MYQILSAQSSSMYVVDVRLLGFALPQLWFALSQLNFAESLSALVCFLSRFFPWGISFLPFESFLLSVSLVVCFLFPCSFSFLENSIVGFVCQLLLLLH
jgi:hypothetical protein